jgi:hypothetical protein
MHLKHTLCFALAESFAVLEKHSQIQNKQNAVKSLEQLLFENLVPVSLLLSGVIPNPFHEDSIASKSYKRETEKADCFEVLIDSANKSR